METQPSHPANSEPFRVVFIGNPGTGKSTLMNGLIGEAKFDSGISLDGIGVTRQITLFTHNGITYCDTPGLDDDQLRKECADEITKALRLGGRFLICFVLSLEAGRIRPADRVTIELITDSAPQIGNNFGVIINKLELKLISTETRDAFFKQLDLNIPLSSLFLYPKDETLFGGGSKIPIFPTEFRRFMGALHPVKLDPNQVNPIEASLYDLKKKQGEEKVEALQNQMSQNEKEFLRQKQAQDQEFKEKIEKMEVDAKRETERQQKETERLRQEMEEKSRMEVDDPKPHQGFSPSYQRSRTHQGYHQPTNSQSQPQPSSYHSFQPPPYQPSVPQPYPYSPVSSQYPPDSRPQSFYNPGCSYSPVSPIPGQPTGSQYLSTGSPYPTTSSPPALPQRQPIVAQYINIVFMGNPGSGKSTFLNGLTEKPVFQSGVSFDGSGVTRELKKFILDVRRFVDTPGLDDDLCREQCAAQITEALKLGGYYAICFVISVRDGHVKSADKNTVKLILESAPEIKSQYSVIFNKIPPKIMTEESKIRIRTQLFSSFQHPTESIFFFPEDPELTGQSAKIPNLTPEFKALIDRVPLCKIDPAKVEKIKTQNWDAQCQSSHDIIAQVQSDHARCMREYREQCERDERTRKEREEQQRILAREMERDFQNLSYSWKEPGSYHNGSYSQSRHQQSKGHHCTLF